MNVHLQFDSDDQSTAVTQKLPVVGGDHIDQLPCVTQRGPVDVIADIRYRWRLRQRWHRAEKSLVLQGKALCRSLVEGGDKKLASEMFDAARKRFKTGLMDTSPGAMCLAPFLCALPQFESQRVKIEKEATKLVKQLPICRWIESVPGIAPNGFVGIVGEAGDVSAYKSVASVWKRMGVAVIGNERQRRKSDVDEALEHGFSPSRRAVLWNVGNGLIGGMWHGPRPLVGEDIDANEAWSPYQKLFLHRCRYLVERDPKEAREPVTKAGVTKESYSAHVAAGAKRYVEKRFLRDLYSNWRALNVEHGVTCNE